MTVEHLCQGDCVQYLCPGDCVLKSRELGNQFGRLVLLAYRSILQIKIRLNAAYSLSITQYAILQIKIRQNITKCLELKPEVGKYFG